MNGNNNGAVTILVVAADRDAYRDLEGHKYSTTDLTVLDCACTSSEALAKAQSLQPDVVLLDAETPGVQCFDLAMQLQEVDLGLGAVVISASKDPQSFRRAIQAGVQEYLIKPVSSREIASTITELSQTRRRRPTVRAARPLQTSEVVAVISARGGVGKSTVAVNLAVLLTQELQKRVALVDMLFGSAAMLLNVAPTVGLMELARHLSEADVETIKTSSVRHSSGVEVYSAFAEPKFTDFLPGSEEFTAGVCAVLRKGYDYLLIEQPMLMGESSLALLREANQVLVIACGLELVTLRETKGLLGALADQVVPRDRLRVIVNRWEPRGFISEADVERTLGFPVWAYLPNDERLVLHSINIGVPVVLERPTAPLSQQLKALARRVAGLPVDAADTRKRFSFLG